jgi:hypothetical protein
MSFTIEEITTDAEQAKPRLVVADECPDTLKVWAAHGSLLPTEIVNALFADINWECRITVCCKHDGTGRFMIRVRDHERRIADGTRSFNLKEHVVNHAGFHVAADHQDQGLGTIFARNSVRVYRLVGVSKVTINAGKTAGGYVWARLGFRPTDDAWKKLRGAVRSKSDAMTSLSAEAREVVTNALADEEPAAIWELADLEEPIDGQPLGRLLLAGTEWEGFLDLADSNAMDKFDAYVALKTGSAP